MNARSIFNIDLTKGLLAASLAIASGIACGALADNINNANSPANVPSIAPLRDGSNPAVAAADEKVRDTKARLDQAHKQLNAAKAMLKAAEAEYKAAEADKEALSLRTEAQRLADASNVDPIANPDASKANINTDNNGLDLSNSRIEGYVPPAATPAIAPITAPAPAPTIQPLSIP